MPRPKPLTRQNLASAALRRKVRVEAKAFERNATDDNLRRLGEAVRKVEVDAFRAAQRPALGRLLRESGVTIESQARLTERAGTSTDVFLSSDGRLFVSAEVLLKRDDDTLRRALVERRARQLEVQPDALVTARIAQVPNTGVRSAADVPQALIDWVRSMPEERARDPRLRAIDAALSQIVNSQTGTTLAQAAGVDFSHVNVFQLLPTDAAPGVDLAPRPRVPPQWIQEASTRHDAWMKERVGFTLGDRPVAALNKLAEVASTARAALPGKWGDPVTELRIRLAIEKALDGIETGQTDEVFNNLAVLASAIREHNFRGLNKVEAFFTDYPISGRHGAALQAALVFREKVESALPPDLMSAAPSSSLFDSKKMVDILTFGFYQWVNSDDPALRATPSELVAFARATERLKGDPGKLLAYTLGKLGPGFVKLGQMLGNRAELVTPVMGKDLARLSDDAPQAPFQGERSIASVLEHELASNAVAIELRATAPVGKPPEGWVEVANGTVWLKPEPLGTGSLKQTHVGWLPDGRIVAVKVMKPLAKERLDENLASLEQVTDGPIRAFVTEARRLAASEPDLNQEAATMDSMRRPMAALGVTVPQVVLATERVMIEDVAVGVAPDKHTSSAARKKAAQTVRRASRGQVLMGKFHNDPHRGNVFVDASGNVTYIDWGLISTITLRERTILLGLLAAAKARNQPTLTRLLGRLDTSDLSTEARHDIVREALDLRDETGTYNSLSAVEQMFLKLQLAGGELPSNVIQASKSIALSDGVQRELAHQPPKETLHWDPEEIRWDEVQ